MTTYTEHDIDRGLKALLAFGGSPTAAHRALKEAFELDIPTGTLKSWRDNVHAELYAKLQEEYGPEIEKAMVRDIRDLARAASTVERLAIEHALEALERGHVRPAEAAQIALNLSKVKQSNIDKLLALTGRPQQITEHRSAAEIIRALEAKGVLELEAGDE